MTMYETKISLTMYAAFELAPLAQRCARDMGFNMNTVVVNHAGMVLVTLRNPQAPDASLEFAVRKAYTPASYA